MILRDPRDEGALCDQCLLQHKRVGNPVFAEMNPRAKFLIVGEAPGEQECEQGKPFVGPSGSLAMSAFGALGIRRGDASWSNALACRPPGNNLEKLMRDLRTRNKARAQEKLQPLPDPFRCCRPRLVRELRQYHDVVTLGGTAMRSVLQNGRGIIEVRGAPVEGWLAPDGAFWSWTDTGVTDPSLHPPPPPGVHVIRVLPTVHPSLVLHARAWERAFRSDVARAWRWFNGKLEWVEPQITYQPSPEALRAFLNLPHPFLAYDVETEFIRDEEEARLRGYVAAVASQDPLTTRMGVIGVASPSSAMVCQFLSIDGVTRPYGTAEEEIKEVLREWFVDPARTKVGFNAGYYDRMTVEVFLGITPAPLVDLILVHRSVEPEASHKLAYVGSVYTDVTAWKADHAGTNAKSDYERDHYNAIDCAVTARLVEPLMSRMDQRQLRDVVRRDHEIQGICVGLHVNGMWVNQKRRAHYDEQFLAEAVQWSRVCQDAQDAIPSHNPNSVPQIVDLLFERWHLPVHHETKTGAPSTDDETIRSLLFDPVTSPGQRRYLDALRRFRRAAKLRGTYITKLRPWGERAPVDDFQYDEEDEEWEELSDYERKQRSKWKQGIVHPDGRVRPDYNAHGTKTRRLSSSNPNAQNFMAKIRDMCEPEEGNVYVYADMDQTQLRGVANVSGAKALIESFLHGVTMQFPSGPALIKDPHSVSTIQVFGPEGIKAYESAIKKYGPKGFKKDPDFKIMRDWIKCVTGETRVLVRGLGLVPMQELSGLRTPDASEPLKDVFVPGADGQWRQAERFYYGGVRPTIQVRTRLGREIEGTNVHRLLTPTGWRTLDALEIGTPLVVQALMGASPPDEVSWLGRGEAEVFDLEVPDGHAFVANGLVNHNTFTYATVFAAKLETVHDLIVSAENDAGELIYQGLSKKVTRWRHQKWLAANPEIPAWWDATVEEWRQTGRLVEPCDGWWREFLESDDEDLTSELANFKIQSAEASLMHRATVALVKGEIPFGGWGPNTGLVQQGHDALVFEVPMKEGPRLAPVVSQAMTQTIPGHPVPYTAEAKLYKNWRDELKE